jgi:hypothetical protein
VIFYFKALKEVQMEAELYEIHGYEEDGEEYLTYALIIDDLEYPECRTLVAYLDYTDMNVEFSILSEVSDDLFPEEAEVVQIGIVNIPEDTVEKIYNHIVLEKYINEIFKTAFKDRVDAVKTIRQIKEAEQICNTSDDEPQS